MTAKARKSTPPGIEPDPTSRSVRHSDVLATVVYDRLGAEMRGVAECMGTYLESLMASGYTRAEAVKMADSWSFQYWDAQHTAAAERAR